MKTREEADLEENRRFAKEVHELAIELAKLAPQEKPITCPNCGHVFCP